VDGGNSLEAPAAPPALTTGAPTTPATLAKGAELARAGTVSRERRTRERQRAILAFATELLEKRRGHREHDAIVLYMQTDEFLRRLGEKDCRWARTSQRTLSRDRSQTVPRIRFESGRPMKDAL